MRAAVSIGLLCLLAPSAFASDGALEINAACVATGCFPGDTGGYPVTITAPGSYRLTSNLSTDSNQTTMIRFDVADVHLDLGGFVMSGPVTCTGTPAVCTGASVGLAGFGIAATPGNGSVRNGTIRGMGRTAVGAGDGMHIEGVHALENGVFGIAGDWGSDGWIVEGCIVRSNGNGGLSLSSGSGTGTLIRHNTVALNGGVGISNNGFLIGNVVRNNADYGTAFNAKISQNVFTGNKAGGNTAQTAGTYDLGGNFCGTDTTCP
jgi:hypothetical protein